MQKRDFQEARTIEELRRLQDDIQRGYEDDRGRLVRQLEDSKRREVELRNKVLRGAPAPESFLIEADERQRIVLAHPDSWEPKGGVIFNYQQSMGTPNAAEHGGDDTDVDLLPASLIVYAYPLPRESADDIKGGHEVEITETDVEDFYKMRQHLGGPMSMAARIRIGGEGTSGIPSLRVTGMTYLEVRDGNNRAITFWEYQRVLSDRADVMLKPFYDEYTTKLTGLNKPAIRASLRDSLGRQLDEGFMSGRLRATTDYVVGRGPDGDIRDSEGEFWIMPSVQHNRSDKATSVDDSEAGADMLADDAGHINSQPGPVLPSKQIPVVSPVALLRVYCVNKALNPPTVFEFEFTDDPTDFTRSSEIFDDVLQSVRFLT